MSCWPAGAAIAGVQFSVASDGGLFGVAELERAITPDSELVPRTRLVSIENTHNREGGAIVSPRHANFIVNDGTATAGDIRTLIERCRTAVRERFGVELLNEIVYVGDF